MESYVAALGEIARTGASEGIRQSAIDRLIACNRCEDALVSQQKVTARAAGSFRRSMLTWTRKAQLQRAALGVDKALEWIVKDKHTGHRLAGRLGATILDRRGPMSAEVATEAVRACPLPVVVKPLGAAGSVGVFVVHADGAVLDLRKREWIGGVESLPARLAETARAEWLLEEYLAKLGDAACPAPDLKFYSFYGKVGVVLEVERYPVLRYAWWNRDGASIRTGQYEHDLFEGGGVTSSQISIAETISAGLPFPFMRIDFLAAKSGLYFCEFTPRPGDFEKFNDATDEMLGTLYLDAELRLVNDLVFGKRFTEFAEWAAPFYAGSAAR